jgi:hypothetical protein
LGKGETLTWTFDQYSNSVSFFHDFFDNPVLTIKAIFVYKLDKDVNYNLFPNNFVPPAIYAAVRFPDMNDMKIVLMDVSGRRGRRKLLYKRVDVLTGHVSKLLLPNDHLCSSLENSNHGQPLLLKDKILVRCIERRTRKWINTLFNITWSHGRGILKAGPAWYGLHNIFTTPDGRLMWVEQSYQGGRFIRQIFPASKQRHSHKVFKVPIHFRPMDYYQSKLAFLYVSFDKYGSISSIKMFRFHCIPSNPINMEFEFCREINFDIHCNAQKGRHSGKLIMLLSNGNLLTLSSSIEDKGKKETIKFFNFFELVQ